MKIETISAASHEVPALPIYSELPAGCMAFVVADASCEPLLQEGDCIAIDPNDCEPVVGAILLRKVGYYPGESKLSLHEVIRAGRTENTWWVGPHRRAPDPEAALIAGQPVGWVDGPFPLEEIRRSFWGRVVGLLASNVVQVATAARRGDDCATAAYKLIAL